MLKMRIWSLLIALTVVASMFYPSSAEAATSSLDELANKARYHTEEKIIDYKDVEKEGKRSVEKTGYNDVEVPIYEWELSDSTNQTSLDKDWTYKEFKDEYYIYPKNNYNQGYYAPKEFNRLYPASRTEPWAEQKEIKKQVPYKVKEPVYQSKTVSRVTQKTQAYSKADTKSKLTAKDKNLKTINVYAPSKTVMSKVNKNWYKGKISYTSYKKTTSYYTNKKIVTDIVYHNKDGKKVKAIISKGAKATKKNSNYYSDVKYTPYKKEKGKWVKQKQVKKSKKISKKDVNSKSENKKMTETKTAFVPSKFIKTKKETEKVGEKTVTKYKTVTEYKQVPVVTNYTAWDKKVQVGTKIEKEPYTYTDEETYTYTVKEPVYEYLQVENTAVQTYTNAVNFYNQHRLSQEEFLQLLQKAEIPYRVENGYDNTRYVRGSVSVGGVPHSYSYTPATLVELLIFDDQSAVNLSYLYEPYTRNDYDDVKISAGGYRIK